MGLKLLLAAVAVALTSARAVLIEKPLPYGELRHRAAPKGIHASRYISSIRYKCSLPHAQLTAVPTGYVAHRCPSSITIDGRLDEPCWQAAAPTEDFVDIVGPTGPEPWLQTTAKILWDDANLYISAELEDPRVFAQETLHDSIIFHDNDFEVFIDPDGDNWMYYEIEVNAAGQVWDLMLVKPYRNGGPPVMNWETIPPAVPTMTSGPTGWRPLQVGVHVDGQLNAAEGSRGWSVELALPWSLLQQAANRQVPPAPGDRWRINFSRVHYNVTWSDQQQRYVKEPTDQPGYNFVWSPQWQVQMHQPETWGFLQFTDALVTSSTHDTTASSSSRFSPDVTWPARALLMDVYYAQTLCWQALGRFCSSLREASDHVDLSDVTQVVLIETTQVSFVASTEVQLADGSALVVMVDQLSRLVQTPKAASGRRLAQFNPFDGNSVWHPPPQAAAVAAQQDSSDMHSECLQEVV